jgi:phenylalanyl-tRNA synthetase beta chain
MVKNHKVLYNEVPKYPGVRRDLALLVDQNVKFEDLKKVAFDAEKYILKDVSLFDVYEDEKIEKGKKSYALCFILQDEKRTLTDKIIDKTMQKLVEVYTNKFNAVLR